MQGGGELSGVLTPSLFEGESHFKQGGVSPSQKNACEMRESRCCCKRPGPSTEAGAGHAAVGLGFQMLAEPAAPTRVQMGWSHRGAVSIPKHCPRPHTVSDANRESSRIL